MLSQTLMLDKAQISHGESWGTYSGRVEIFKKFLKNGVSKGNTARGEKKKKKKKKRVKTAIPKGWDFLDGLFKMGWIKWTLMLLKQRS